LVFRKTRSFRKAGKWRARARQVAARRFIVFSERTGLRPARRALRQVDAGGVRFFAA
jgi:hypothetical protein